MAGQVIDSLMITLGLNASGVKSGAKEADDSIRKVGNEADKTKEKLQDAGKHGAEAFSSLGKSALQFLAILGGTVAIKNFVTDTVKSTAAIGRFAENLGMSVNSVSAWGHAARLAGGTAEGLQGTLAMLSRAQTEYQLTGNTGMLPYLSQLNVQLTDAGNKSRPLVDVMTDISKAVTTRIPGDRAKQHNFLAMMGIDEGTINLMLKGPVAMRAMVAERERASAVTAKEVAEAEKLRVEFEKVNQQMEKLGREVVTKMAPAIMDLTKAFGDLWAQVGPDLVKIIGGFTDLNKNLDNLPVKILVAAAAFRILGGAAILGGIAKLATALRGAAAGAAAVEAATTATAAAAGGGAATAAASSAAPSLVARLLGGAGMLFASEELNKGEDEFLASRWGGKKFTAPSTPIKNVPPEYFNTPQKAQSAGKSTSQMFADLERANGLPAGMLDKYWAAESGRGRGAMVSRSGATGHFQFMPQTAKAYGLSRDDTYDLQKSASAAAKMLGELYRQQGGDQARTAAAWNFGSGNMARADAAGRSYPAETLAFQQKVRVGGNAASSARDRAGVTNQYNIDRVEIKTNATDAEGIMNDMRGTMDYMFTSQADYGLTP